MTAARWRWVSLAIVAVGASAVGSAPGVGADPALPPEDGFRTSLPASADNTLYEDATGSISNGSGDAVYAGDNQHSNTRRAVLHFDVASALPSDARVLGVELRLTIASAPDATPRVMSLYRVRWDWGEGASAGGGQGASAEPGDATWLHRFHPDQPWDTPGGDIDPTVLATAVAVDSGTVVWSGPALEQDVERWLRDPGTNAGWMVRGEEGLPSSVRSFHSRESLEETLRPLLVVDWEAQTPIEETSWSRLKGVHRSR